MDSDNCEIYFFRLLTLESFVKYTESKNCTPSRLYTVIGMLQSETLYQKSFARPSHEFARLVMQEHSIEKLRTVMGFMHYLKHKKIKSRKQK